MKVLKLNTNAVKACLLASAKNDALPFLNGVFVDLELNCLVGTNRHILAVSKPEKFIEVIQDDDNKNHIILSRESLEQFFKILPKKVEEFTLIIADDDKVIFKTDVIDFQGSLIKGFRFSDWKRIYPKGQNGSTQNGFAYVNPHYLALLGKMASLWDKSLGYSLIQYGASPMDVVLCSLNNDDMHVLIMPMRNPNGNNVEPSINYFLNKGV